MDPFASASWYEALTAGERAAPGGAGSRRNVAVPLAPWLERLRDAYVRHGSQPRGPGEPLSFIELARPLVAAARADAADALGRISAERPLPFDVPLAIDFLTAHLEAKLHQILARTLVLELNVARLQGTLEGDTPEERFRSFALQMRDPARAVALLAEYPVLARQLVGAVENGVAFCLEFLERLASDWEDLRGMLGADPGRLADVIGGVGDTHRSGRSVLIARFASGSNVVYKPRPLSLDAHFQELLAFLDARGNTPPFRTLRILDRGDHGWVEFVQAETCTTPEELARFYRRQGAYLALLYLLDATDFHTENLIACGEHPVLLDLEALFHARLPTPTVSNPAHRAAARCLDSSVLRIGLLPQRVWGDADSEGVDLSGLGSVAEQKTPFRVPLWQKGGTDEMHLAREQIEMPVGNNRPTLRGADVDVLEYADDICAGFTGMYHLLERSRDELAAAGGPLERFADDEVRVILRPTQTYGVLLRESFHPDMLRSALDRAQLFERLGGPVKQQPWLARVISAEVKDLEGGDVPMFTTRPSSRDVWTAAGERLPEFFEEPSLAHVRRRLSALGPADLERQLWFVRASLATVSRVAHGARAAARAGSGADVSREELLDAARAVGDELERRALQEDGAATWIGLTQHGLRHWSLVPLGWDLYDGLPGVALFLAYLADVTGEVRYGDLARAGARALRDDLPEVREQLTWVGGYIGLGGVAHAFAHLAALWRDDDLLREAHATAELVGGPIDSDDQLDVISGAAGAIGALLALHRHDPSARVLEAARRCGDRLLATARPMSEGIGWLTPVARTRPLSGFSHGAAGMAWSLLRLAHATGEHRFHAAALAAIAYERTLYAPALRNWWDLREAPAEAVDWKPGHCGMSWCHGAPGIGLARLDTLAMLDDASVRSEIDAAIRATRDGGFGESHSLCHGDLGNLELLVTAARVLGDPALDAEARRHARGTLDDIRASGWHCGNPLRVESPGLMTGLAGIGYGLLRLAAPDRVPSVLLFEPPPRVSALS